MHRARPIILDRNIKYKEVSDMNNNKGALNQSSEATKNENEEQISYIISRQTS